jgi:hypothetical protein
VQKFRPLVVVLSLTAIVGGCGPEGLEEQGMEGEGESALELATMTQELSYSNGGSWSSPNPPTVLASTSDRACFFTRVRGKFDSGGDSVRILANAGKWDLGGTGSTKASAACATLPGDSGYSTAYDWTEKQRQPVNLGSAEGRVCFLTRVGGSFNSPRAWVSVYTSGGSWFLSGDLQGQDGFARARCVTVSSYSGEYSWDQSKRLPTHMGSSGGRVCALTAMAGQFKGDTEFVDISKVGGQWYLSGGSARSGVTAKARCF